MSYEICGYKKKTCLFEMFKVQVAVLDDVKWLVAQNFPRVCFKDRVELFGEGELLSVLGRHFWVTTLFQII